MPAVYQWRPDTSLGHLNVELERVYGDLDLVWQDYLGNSVNNTAVEGTYGAVGGAWIFQNAASQYVYTNVMVPPSFRGGTVTFRGIIGSNGTSGGNARLEFKTTPMADGLSVTTTTTLVTVPVPSNSFEDSYVEVVSGIAVASDALGFRIRFGRLGADAADTHTNGLWLTALSMEID